MPPHASEELADRLRPFATCFTAAIWRHVPVLVAGALLAPGRRTVTAALRVMALDRTASFAVYHRVLSTARWSARAVARRLLLVLVATFVRDGPVVVGIDDTIERRWGARIEARGIYRDPVRSSRGHFVKASGLRWLCLMVMAPMPWGGVRGLPFLTVLAPSERYAHARGRRHKALRPRPRATPQGADRPGAPSPAADRALAARPARGRGGGQQLLRHRAAARGRPMPVHGHPPAPRCRSL